MPIDIIGIVVFGLYTSWLAYLQLYKEKRDRLVKRYGPGSAAREVFQRAYSIRALLACTLICLGFILDLVANVLKDSHAHSSITVVRVADICGLAFFLSGACLGGVLARRLERRNLGSHHGGDWLV